MYCIKALVCPTTLLTYLAIQYPSKVGSSKVSIPEETVLTRTDRNESEDAGDDNSDVYDIYAIEKPQVSFQRIIVSVKFVRKTTTINSCI